MPFSFNRRICIYAKVILFNSDVEVLKTIFNDTILYCSINITILKLFPMNKIDKFVMTVLFITTAVVVKQIPYFRCIFLVNFVLLWYTLKLPLSLHYVPLLRWKFLIILAEWRVLALLPSVLLLCWLGQYSIFNFGRVRPPYSVPAFIVVIFTIYFVRSYFAFLVSF